MAEVTVSSEWTTAESPVRQAAKALHLQGVPYVDIASRLQRTLTCISGWAKRDKWADHKKAVSSTITITQNAPKPEEYAVRGQLHEHLKVMAKDWPTKKPKDPRGLKDYHTAFHYMAMTAKLVEGWSDMPTASICIHSQAEQPAEKYAEKIVTPSIDAQITDTSADSQPVIDAPTKQTVQ